MDGTTLSHFRILEKIGEGGMGVIYRAEDVNLGRTVALKVLPPDLVGDESRRQRFIEEARTAAAVTHPHIATIHEVDEADGTAFIAMELIEGRSLRDHLGGHAIPVKEAVRLGTEIAEAMAAAHQAGIIHRDLKPDNVMVGKDGHARVLDFGLAQLLDRERAPESDAGAKTTVVDSNIFGTPAYMSPEQARGKPLDVRSDIFSFGCTLHEMVTGAPPFKGATASDTISQVLNREPVPAVTLNPDVPDGLQWVLNKCLDKDPSQRYQDARDLAVDLRHIATDSGSQATAAARARTGAYPAAGGAVPLWKRPAVIGAAVVVVALAAFGLSRLFTGGGLKVSPAAANSIAVFSFENLKDPDDPERLGQILQELVITDLSGLDPVKVLSSQRLHDVQKQVGIKEERGDKDRTTEVAVKAGAGRMLTGSLSKLGERWILSAQLVDVKTGEVVQSKRIDGDDLYTMVDMLTADLQSELRLAAAPEIQATPVKEKTSNSLEAYKHYLAGVENLNSELFDQAQAELRKAIEIDPNFGQAYYKLAVALWWPNDDLRAAREPIQTLLTRKLYTSERERRMAEAMLDLLQRKFSESEAVYQQLTQDYPDEKEAWYGLGESQFHARGGGREEESLVAFRRALALDPDFRLPYQHIFDTYRILKQPEKAQAEARKLLESDPSDPTWNRFYALAAGLGGDAKAIEAALKQALVYNTTPEEQQRLYLALADAAGNRGDTDARIARIKQAAAATPDDAGMQRRVATTLMDERRLEEFQRTILEGLARDPGSEAWQSAARGVWRDLWEYDRIMAQVESLAVAFPDDPAAARTWVYYAVQMGDDPGARALAHARKLHHSPDELRALNQTLVDAYDTMQDRTRQGETIERMAEAAEEPDAQLCGAMAMSRFFLGELDEAKSWLKRAEAQNPRNGGVLAGGAFISAMQGDFQAARGYVDRIGQLLPRSPFFYNFRSAVAILEGRMDEVDVIDREAMQDLATPGQKYDYLTEMRPWMLIHHGDWKRAEASLRQAAAVDPAPEALIGLALCLAHRGDIQAARDAVQRGLKRFPLDQDLLAMQAMVELQGGDPARAEEIARSLVQTPPVRANKYSLLGKILADRGQYADAVPWLERAEAMSPDRFTLCVLAHTLVVGNIDRDRGVEVATRATNLTPIPFGPPEEVSFWPPPEETLGLAAIQREEFAEAVGWLETAAEKNPNRPTIREALDLARAKATGTP